MPVKEISLEISAASILKILTKSLGRVKIKKKMETDQKIKVAVISIVVLTTYLYFGYKFIF